MKLLQFAVLLLSAPLMRGIIAKLKAWLQRRQGAGIWRPYADLGKLFRKEDIVPSSASWLFRAAPRLAFAFTLAAAAFVPVVVTGGMLSFTGDFFVLIYLLAFARFLLLLGALDGGSSFGGMGASREAMVSVLAEAPLVVSLMAVAITARAGSLAGIVEWTRIQSFFNISVVHVLALTAMVFVAIAETGRLPVDNPTTHLELTMLHEAMVLEYSGPSLAFVEWTHAIKLNLLIALLIALFAPWGIAAALTPGAIAISAIWFLLKVWLVLVAIAVLESAVAKLRMYAVPEFFGIATALAVLAMVFTVILKK
ncbi:MAG TPA: NADH-quinone oxidoreductase subunit H [Candidatus Saccharimonadales bacterium]|nr:NADH-quinone oxidoreductase subunit H [Candidatus Saccharimonadales bacterium]